MTIYPQQYFLAIIVGVLLCSIVLLNGNVVNATIAVSAASFLDSFNDNTKNTMRINQNLAITTRHETNVIAQEPSNITTSYGNNQTWIPFMDTCLDMNHLEYINFVLGYRSTMPYMLSGQWTRDTGLWVCSILVSIFVVLCFLADLVLYIVHRYRRDKQTYTNWLVLLFNLTNAFLFVVLTQVGWTSNGFFVAAVHNSIECLFCLVLFKKYFPSLFKNRILYNIFQDVLLLIMTMLTMPHLIITDFKINSYIKASGGVFDLLLFLICIVSFIKYGIDWIRIRIFKHTHVLVSPRRHMLLLLNLFSHTFTVVLSFATCTTRIPHAIVILIGTLIMNPVGTAYFVYQLRDKPISIKNIRIAGHEYNVQCCLDALFPPAAKDEDELVDSAKYAIKNNVATSQDAVQQQQQQSAQPLQHVHHHHAQDTPQTQHASPSLCDSVSSITAATTNQQVTQKDADALV